MQLCCVMSVATASASREGTSLQSLQLLAFFSSLVAHTLPTLGSANSAYSVNNKTVGDIQRISDIGIQFSSVAQSCLTLCGPMDCGTPGLPVHHQLSELAQTHGHQVSVPSNHLILCRPLLLLPSIFPSIRVFSMSQFIRWQKYWSFNFSISPSNEYSGLISFRID